MDREFLEAIATEYQLSPEQRAAFVLRFDPAHSGENEAKLASHLNIGASTFKKRMTQVYKRMEPLCPELASVRRGKVEKLRAALQQRFEQGMSAREEAGKPELETEEEDTAEPLNVEDAEQRGPEQSIEGDGNQAVAHAENSAVIQSISNVRDVHIHVGTEAPKEPRLKLGAPMPGVRLPENFVPRPDALDAVKAKLLPEAEQTLVVSAISGLGGLGKSVLATAIVLDPEVQARFDDGILWVTLGQNPDLQSMLGDWIRTLDKSRDSYSATTLESARSYLHNLLLERRMLLVVDDVWNAAHADWFRVGGPGCRVLVTTREAQLEGAEYFALDVMGEVEAVELVRQKLGKRWQAEDEPEFKAFAKSLGYLPLALDLAANQVRDGLSWAELQQEFEAERREVALELLDSSECWEELDEQQQRKYSLQACFNLSLKRLKPLQLKQFAWLGVLPEDVLIEAQMAKTLWGLSIVKAKRLLLLIDFRRRSLLTEGIETFEGERTYRVHDLMHDTAQGLIEKGELIPMESRKYSKSATETIQLAHQLFLSQYGVKTENDWWKKLPEDDGYLYHHLTWHLEKASLENEIHSLITASDERGRNFWFEACDRAGKPAIFSEDIKRGWKLLDNAYDLSSADFIISQCKYALITSTLHGFAERIPIRMMTRLVRQGFWKFEQAWSHVDQLQDEQKITTAIKELIPLASKGQKKLLINKAKLIKTSKLQVEILKLLIRTNELTFFEELGYPIYAYQKSIKEKITDQEIWINEIDFEGTLQIAILSEDNDSKSSLIKLLSRVKNANFLTLVDAAKGIGDDYSRVLALCDLLEMKNSIPEKILEQIDQCHDLYAKALGMVALAKKDKEYLSKAFNFVLSINDQRYKISSLSKLAMFDKKSASTAMDLLRSSTSFHWILDELAESTKVDIVDFLNIARIIADNPSRLIALIRMSMLLDESYSSKFELEIQAISDPEEKARIWLKITEFTSQYYTEAEQAINEIRNSYTKTELTEELKSLKNLHYKNMELKIKEVFFPPCESSESTFDANNKSIAQLKSLSEYAANLHCIASQPRQALMQEISTTASTTVYLGGREALIGVIEAMEDVCRQWP